jgi:hypothetical protein
MTATGNSIAELNADLASTGGSRVLIAVAGYPRVGWTGELENIGRAIERTLSLLSQHGGRAFRVMHGQGVVLVDSADDLVPLVKDVISTCIAPTVEIRALVVPFIGKRGAVWIDELLGDLSVRGNFGRFSDEHVVRFIDGRLIDVDRE